MAADILRPHSAYPGFTQDDVPQYVDTNVELGDQVLTSGFKDHLSRYFETASFEDKARCLELLTSLDLSEAAKKQTARPSSAFAVRPPQPPNGSNKKQYRRHRRPQTAMATTITARDVQRPLDNYGAYTTTYDREFWGNPGEASMADRPSSTRAYQAPYNLSGPIGDSNYSAEFCKKYAFNNEQIRSGSATGNRRNNPHPSEAFMNWRLSTRQEPYSAFAMGLTDDIMDQVCRGQLRSTYQNDYLGTQQGEGSAQPMADDPNQSRIHYSLASQMRHSYRRPVQQDLLRGNTYRYGCNKQKLIPANGVVPTVSTRQMNLKTRTTYDRDYTENLKPPGTVDVRELGRNYASNSIAARGSAYGEDQRAVERMMASLRVNTPTSRPGGRINRYPSPDQNMISPWVGPM